MPELLAWFLSELVAATLPGRVAIVAAGVACLGGGALLMASGLRGSLIGGAAVIAVGGIILWAGFVLRAPLKAKAERAAPTPPDDWTPPKAEDVRKIVGGR